MGIKTKFAFAALALLAPALIAADKHDKNHNDVFIPGSADENRIAREVRHQLVMLPYYGIFDDLAFRVNGSAVTLMGAVTRPTLKSDAERVVKHVEGVTQVDNEIEVLPPSSMDDRIRMAEYRAIYGDPSLATRYGYRALPSIHIIVKNGNVTLKGVVQNSGDAAIAGMRANTTPGVFSVDNDLLVANQEK